MIVFMGRGRWLVAAYARIHGPLIEGGCRYRRTAESVQFFKARCTDRRIGWNFKGDAGIHGPLNWSEFSKRDPRTVESVGIFEGGRRY